MNREDIIRMAREAGFNTDHDLICIEGWEISPYMQRFAALVAAHERKILRRDGWRKCAAGQRTTQFCAMTEEAVKAEREACARVCFDEWKKTPEPGNARDCCDAIRARGEK